MAKSLAIGVVIGAALSGGFHSAVGGAVAKFNTLGTEIKSLAGQRGLIERFEKDGAALEKARLALSATQMRVAELKLALRKNPADEGTAKALEQTQAKAVRLSASLEKQRQALRASEQALGKAGIKVGDLGREYARLGSALEKTRAKHERLEARLAKKSAAGQRLGELKGQVMGMAGAVYAAGRLVGQAMDFETAEVRLSTVLNTDDLPGAVAAARKHALDFARTGLSTETEMLDIQYALNSAGLDASAARAGSEIVAKVAKITNGAAEGVGEVIATTFNNLGASLEGSTEERLTRIGELLTKTQFKFQIRDFDQLGESMKYATPALAQYGVELEQGVTLIGALNSAGMQGGMAGTALSATFRQLSKASAEFGFELVRSADGNLDFIATLENLSDSIGGFEGMDQKTIDRLQKAFGDEGQRGVVLLGAKLKELRAAQDDVAAGSRGLIDTSYQRFTNSTAGQTTILTNNLRILGTTFAGTLLPSVNALLAPLATVAKRAGVLIERFPWVGRLVGGVAAGVGVFVGTLTAVTAATWLWNAALLANPIGLVIGAVVGAAALIITFWGPITTFFEGLWSGVRDVFLGTWDAVVGGLASAWEKIKTIFSAGVSVLVKIWEMSPLGLLFKAGKALAGWVGGAFSAGDETPGAGLARAATAATLGVSLIASPMAAVAATPPYLGPMRTAPLVQPVGRPETLGPMRTAPLVQPVGRPETLGTATIRPLMQPAGLPETQGKPPYGGRSGLAKEPLPLLSPRGEGSSVTTINAPITVHAAPGMDEKKLAEQVGIEMDKRAAYGRARQRGALHD